jgi:hypothetical protein
MVSLITFLILRLNRPNDEEPQSGKIKPFENQEIFTALGNRCVVISMRLNPGPLRNVFSYP